MSRPSLSRRKSLCVLAVALYVLGIALLGPTGHSNWRRNGKPDDSPSRHPQRELEHGIAELQFVTPEPSQQ